MADTAEKNCIQIIAYIRRKRSLTPAQFYDRWENVHAPIVVPWAEKHGLRRYQQIHISGKIVPSSATESSPNAVSTAELPTEPVEFDGIAMFLVPSLQQFTDAFEDPYYVEIIEPDEQELIDKDGPGSGVLASYQGKMIDMLHRGQSTIRQTGRKCHEAFEAFEKKRGAGV